MSVIHSDETISLQRLSFLVSEPITQLHLQNVILQGTSDDLYNFTRCIRGHPYLKDIALINVRFEKPKLSLDSVVCTIFATVKGLVRMHLEHVSVPASALATVAHSRSNVLRTLALPHNGLDDADAVQIAAAIAHSLTITDVDLSFNELTDPGCLAIAGALQKNTSVLSVNLEGNGRISPEYMHLLSALKRCGGMARAA
jgi:hypothetical protein